MLLIRPRYGVTRREPSASPHALEINDQTLGPGLRLGEVPSLRNQGMTADLWWLFAGF